MIILNYQTDYNFKVWQSEIANLRPDDNWDIFDIFMFY